MFVRKTCQCLSGLIFQLDAQLLHFLPQGTQTAASGSIESCNFMQPNPWNLLGDGMSSFLLFSDTCALVPHVQYVHSTYPCVIVSVLGCLLYPVITGVLWVLWSHMVAQNLKPGPSSNLDINLGPI